MKVDKNITKGLAQSGLVMNVIGGGMSMPDTKTEKREDCYLFKMSIPGVDADLMSIEINNNHLFIFQKMEFGGIVVPYMVKRLIIPAEVEFDQVSAQYEDGQLHVIMPFNELAGGYHREIDIEKN